MDDSEERRGDASIIRFGQTAKGTQRFRCKICDQTFVETTGTLFYGKRTPKKDILFPATRKRETTQL